MTVTVCVAGVDAEPLHLRLEYLSAFPIKPPHVQIVAPSIDLTETGHTWHRWYDGRICYVRPVDWNISATGDQIIAKAMDWYFNYVAVKRGLISQMPDVGRAEINPRAEL